MRTYKKILLQLAVSLIGYVPLYLLLLGSSTSTFGQTTYYVASSGNDSNSGRSSDSPFQTISKVNSLVLQPGDQVLFRRNDTFRGSLKILQSGTAGNPIVIDAYGSGSKPTLSGSVAITNWTSVGTNTWQASCPTCGDQLTGLYRANTALPLGRYPNLDASNKGYLTVQSHSGKTQLTSQQSLSTNWTGGEVVFRPVQWILNRAAITGQNGNTLTVVGSGNYDISNNWGYFIQNHPATLDQTGEWYYNPANKTIRVYDSQSNPNSQAITATTLSEGVNLSAVAYVTIRNLRINQTLATGLLVSNSSNIVISNTDVTQSGEDAISIKGNGQQVVLEANLIEDANNNGVAIDAYQNVTVRGNTIRRIGLIPGRGKSGDGTYVGFQSASNTNTLIEDNILDNIGYNALNFSTNTTVQRNHISNFCVTKSDGSGLYIWNGNQQPMNEIRLLSNVIYNGMSASEGTPSGTATGANGIYLDDCTTNIDVTGNSVYNCQGLGIYLHGSSNIRLTGNTAYNNNGGQLAITSAGGCQPRNNLIQNNIFVSRLANQFTVKYESDQNDLVNYGQFDNNTYARPFEDTYKVLAVYNTTTGANLSLAQWQSRYNKDLTTTNSPLTYSSGNPDDYIKCLANPTASASQVSLVGTFRDMKNRVCSGQVTIPAFSSVVLLKDIVLSTPLRDPENPTNTVTGLDYQYYEGSWSALPDFNTLTPVKSGTVVTADIAIRNRTDQYSVRYKGYINVPTDGVYTFYTSSDDGSKLLIGTTEVVSNDGVHGSTEKSGTIGLKAGKHALCVLFFQGSGGQELTVRYEGPGISKQVIPASAFYRVRPSGGNGSGLLGSYFNNTTLTAPTTLSRTDATVNFDWGTNSPGTGVNTDNFSVRWTGQVEAPFTGSYTFSTTSDDGVRLWVNGTQLVNNWSTHAATTNNGSPITLIAGQRYTIQMEYYDGTGGAVAKLLWAYSGQTQQPIPQNYLYPATAPPSPTGAPSTTAATGTGIYLSDLNWASATNGYGSVEKDRSNGESNTGDGRTITLNGVTYAKGLGVHSPSEITYNLNGQYTRFLSDIGLDDEVSGCGTVSFEVYADNVLIYSSGIMNTTTATKSIDLNVAGKQTLKLVVTTGGDGNTCDHADWAGARLLGTSGARLGSRETNELSLLEPTMHIYPMPAQENIMIRYFSATAGEATVQLINIAALAVSQTLHQVKPGENIIQLAVDQLSRGSYVLALTHNNQRLSRKVILTE